MSEIIKKNAGVSNNLKLHLLVMPSFHLLGPLTDINTNFITSFRRWCVKSLWMNSWYSKWDEKKCCQKAQVMGSSRSIYTMQQLQDLECFGIVILKVFNNSLSPFHQFQLYLIYHFLTYFIFNHRNPYRPLSGGREGKEELIPHFYKLIKDCPVRY